MSTDDIHRGERMPGGHSFTREVGGKGILFRIPPEIPSLYRDSPTEHARFYQILFQAIPTPLLVLSPSGEILDTNPAAQAFLDAPREALLRGSAFDLFDLPAAPAPAAALASGETIPLKARYGSGGRGVGTPVFDGENRMYAILLSLDTPALHPAGPPAPPAERLPARILLVEDHDDTRQVLSTLLRREGYRLVSAATCCEAMALACLAIEEGCPFEILISDLGLPDGSGLSLVGEVKALFPHLSAIALSGYGSDDDVIESLRAGFIRHYTKPVSIETLRRAITQIVANA